MYSRSTASPRGPARRCAPGCRPERRHLTLPLHTKTRKQSNSLLAFFLRSLLSSLFRNLLVFLLHCFLASILSRLHSFLCLRDRRAAVPRERQRSPQPRGVWGRCVTMTRADEGQGAGGDEVPAPGPSHHRLARGERAVRQDKNEDRVPDDGALPVRAARRLPTPSGNSHPGEQPAHCARRPAPAVRAAHGEGPGG